MAKRQRELKGGKEVTNKFALLLDDTLTALDANSEQLALEMGINSSVISRFRKGSRLPTRNYVCRIVYGLARIAHETEQRGIEVPTELGPAVIDLMLSKFLVSAGFSDSYVPSEPNVLWRKVTENGALRVGWMHCPPWTQSDSGTSNVVGASADVTQAVARLLQLRVEWTELSEKTLMEAVMQRRVDVLAPFLMTTPWRATRFLFSKPVFDRHMAIKGVVSSSVSSDVTDVKHIVSGTQWDLVFLSYDAGQIAEFLLPTQYANVLTYSRMEECYYAMTASDNCRRLFVGGETACRRLLDSAAGQLREITFSDSQHVNLPLAFVVQRHESEMLRVINSAIDLVFEYLKKIPGKYGA